MATLRDIKKRIITVKNTQKITKAMKMVAAAKLRRAQMAVIGARPYTDKIGEIIHDLLSRSDATQESPFISCEKAPQKIQIIVFTSNRGLCGGFNSNLLRRSESFLRELHEKSVARKLTVMGKKGREYFRARSIPMDEILIDEAESLSFEAAQRLSQGIIDEFLNHNIDEVHLVFNRFVSVISQEITIKKILPLDRQQGQGSAGADYIFEPERNEILKTLVPRYLANQIYRAHLESRASELGARMSAMENATNNAKEMIGSLTLKYNRARQAAITVELMDIVNGAEAIK